MNIRKGTPGEGAQARADSFSYFGPDHGLKHAFTAWLAGEVYWAKAHEHTDALPGTKPCLDWLTEGELRCPRCRPQVLPIWVGWVPLYREVDHKPICVIVKESGMDLLKGLVYPNCVLVGRVGKKDAVFVRKSESPVSFRTDNEQRKRPIDITNSLLTMWKLPTFEAWLCDRRREQRVNAVEQPEAVRLRLSVPPPTTRVEALAIDAERDPPPAGDVPFDDVMKRIKTKFKVPSKNGHHKNNGEGGES